MTAEPSSTRCALAHRAAVPVLTLCLLAAACGGNNSGDSGAAAAHNSERTEAVLTLAVANASFTDADLDAYERGLKAEIAAVEAARREASAAQAEWERPASHATRSQTCRRNPPPRCAVKWSGSSQRGRNT